jgi:hypothetical protein
MNQNPYAMETESKRCSLKGFSTRYRLKTKFVMWAAAALSASIFAVDPVSLIGNYLIYCSSGFRAARLYGAMRASTRSGDEPADDLDHPKDDPTLDSRIELLANRLLTCQHFYYISCALITLGGQAVWWSYPHDGFISQLYLGHLWNVIDGLSSPFSFFFLVRECQEFKYSGDSGKGRARLERRATLTKVEAREAELIVAEEAGKALESAKQAEGEDADASAGSGGSELSIIGEHLYSVLVNGAMLCLAVFSLCVGRGYGALDFAMFSASMAYGCIEPFRRVGYSITVAARRFTAQHSRSKQYEPVLHPALSGLSGKLSDPILVNSIPSQASGRRGGRRTSMIAVG